MIISCTPYRISFLGGGSDYHTWYQQHGGAVLTTTINRYCYITCRPLPPFFPHHSRVVWSEIEEVKHHTDIRHPAVRAVLNYLNITHGVEIQHQGDLPARSGLGSSSAFTVGLLNAVYAMRGEMSSKRELACEAVKLERDIMRENVGVQDQIQTAFGGFNKIVIHPDGDFNVSPVILPNNRLYELHRHLLLFFTGMVRTASDIAGKKMKIIPNKIKPMKRLRELVDEGLDVLTSEQDIAKFGELLDENWQLKRGLVSDISTDFIDDIYNRAKKAGTIGAKLLGAGGGGFMLFFVKPEDQPKVLEALSDLLLVPFEFEKQGSRIIYYDNPFYSRTSMFRRDFAHLPKEISGNGKKRLTRLPLREQEEMTSS